MTVEGLVVCTEPVFCDAAAFEAMNPFGLMFAGLADVDGVVACNDYSGSLQNGHEMWHASVVHGCVEHVQELTPRNVIGERQVRLVFWLPLIVEKDPCLVPGEFGRSVASIHQRGLTYVEEGFDVLKTHGGQNRVIKEYRHSDFTRSLSKTIDLFRSPPPYHRANEIPRCYMMSGHGEGDHDGQRSFCQCRHDPRV